MEVVCEIQLGIECLARKKKKYSMISALYYKNEYAVHRFLPFRSWLSARYTQLRLPRGPEHLGVGPRLSLGPRRRRGNVVGAAFWVTSGISCCSIRGVADNPPCVGVPPRRWPGKLVTKLFNRLPGGEGSRHVRPLDEDLMNWPLTRWPAPLQQLLRNLKFSKCRRNGWTHCLGT